MKRGTTDAVMVSRGGAETRRVCPKGRGFVRSKCSTSHAPWPKVKLREVSHGIYDGPHATPPSCETPGYYFLGIPQVTPAGHIDLANPRYISRQDYKTWTKRVVPREGDVVFSYEATLNLYARIPNGIKCCLGRRMGLVRPDETKLDSRYLYYYFFSPEWRRTVTENTVVGATVDRLPIKTFPAFQITLPPLPVQRRIADMLSAYDDLIENNRRRIAILEGTARFAYRKWFGGGVVRETRDVRRDKEGRETIDETHVSRFSSKTPRVSRLSSHAQPKTVPLGEICQSFGGGTPKTGVAEYWNGDIPWVVPTDVTRNSCLALLDSERKITALGLEKSSAKMLPANAILMTSRASVGYFAIADFPVCTNQGFISIVPNDFTWRWYLLFNLMSRVEEIRGNAKGSTFPEISRARFRSMDIPVPDKESLAAFNDIVTPLMQQVRTLSKQSAALAAARDMLLPRLMKGEVA